MLPSRFVVPATAAVLALSGCSTIAEPPIDGGRQTASDAVPEEAVWNIASENSLPGNRGWRAAKTRSSDWRAMSGFADRSSATPGDRVRLFVSTGARKWRVSAYRMGWYGGAQGRRVWTSEVQPGQRQDGSGFVAATRTSYADWRQSLSFTTQGWSPGMYLLRLKGSNGAESLIPLVVRSPDVAGRIVLVMADTTWQAYNEWGGRSAYFGPGGFEDRARAVSFARPYTSGSGTGKYLAYEHPVVRMAERLGIDVSYVAASDLDVDPRALSGAEGVLSLGHNEYWSVPQRAAVTKARDAGVDLAFLGANTMFWRVRLVEGPAGARMMEIYKSAWEDPVDGPTTTARFRDEPGADPEHSLVGQDYECYPATGTYTVTDPGFFLFRGTGIGVNGTVPGILDVEVDRAYPVPGTPKNLRIVAASPVDCEGASTVSTSSYYTAKSGAGVFATGTMGWVLRGLRNQAPPAGRAFAKKVTTNLLRAMANGQMGRKHPAVGNIGDFDLPTWNTTGRE
ncbi:MAG: DUF6605 domain-containing protein [Candidatus Nanopelagicales bacterium]|nr:DUF6605 domain-containing protein [Candidatus Nanopelagicales bacterium]